MQVYLKALGCRLNEAELEQWARDFQAKGHQITRQADQADLVVVNTCAVTAEATRKSRQLIRRSLRHNPAARLVISGCYSSLEPDQSAAIDGIDLLVANAEKDRLVDIVTQRLDTHSMPVQARLPDSTALFRQGRNRAFIKIQDGCRHRCTFCIVTIARGAERSRPVADIINEINTLHAGGIMEVVLTGVHVGGYGRDIDSSLYTLLATILAGTDIPRIRLGSLEPWDLPDNFFQLFDNPRLMPHLHLPLQSGSDSVLKRMARRCKTGDFADLIARARATIKHFNVTTDIIVGFPGETDEEWQDSLAFIESMAFANLHIFSYSKRAGTRAAAMPNPVCNTVKKERSRELHQLGLKMEQANLEKCRGETHEVLWETQAETADTDQVLCSGYTPNYLRVRMTLPADLKPANTIMPVRLGSIDSKRGTFNATLV